MLRFALANGSPPRGGLENSRPLVRNNKCRLTYRSTRLGFGSAHLRHERFSPRREEPVNGCESHPSGSCRIVGRACPRPKLWLHCENANGGILFHQISKGGHPKRDRSNRKGTSTLRHYGNEIRRTPANVGVVVRHSKTWWSTTAMGQRRSSGAVRDRSAHTQRAAQQRTFRHFAVVQKRTNALQ